MRVISEKQLCSFLTRGLELSGDCLRRIPDKGTQTVEDDLLDRYHQFVNDLNAELANDPHLDDKDWNWIWEGKSGLNHIRLYGRLAWVNLQLLELL